MKKFTAFIMTLVIAICTTSFYAYANDDIEKDGAIETAINFLSLVEEKNYEKAQKLLVDERSIVNEFGFTFKEFSFVNDVTPRY